MPARTRDTFVVDPGPLGARVRRIRTDRGLTRSQIPGVSRSTLDIIEAGRGLPSLDTAIRLAATLGVTLDTLVGMPIASPAAPLPAAADEGAGSSNATITPSPGCVTGGKAGSGTDHPPVPDPRHLTHR